MSKTKVKWIPKSFKFKLQHKTHLKKIGPQSPRNKVIWGEYGLKVLQAKRLSAKPLEAARRLITRQLKKKEMIWIRAVPNIPVTTKPIQIRMGKGKGNVSYWTYNLKAGSILFELGCIDPSKVHRMFRTIKDRVGLPCTTIIR